MVLLFFVAYRFGVVLETYVQLLLSEMNKQQTLELLWKS